MAVHHPRMRMIAAMAALLLALLPARGWACTLVGDGGLTRGQQDEDLRTQFQRSPVVVEVVAMVRSHWRSRRPGLVRVERVYKGNLRVGTRLPIFAMPPAMCGSGDIHFAQRGVLMLGSLGYRLQFYGFVSTGRLARLRQLGLLPPR
jgi:hypothetical protein